MKDSKYQKKRTLIKDIAELYTLAPASQKEARHCHQYSDLGMIPNACLLIEGEKIIWVGPQKQLPKNLAQSKSIIDEISMQGRILFPAFVEAHTHLPFAGSRSEEFEKRLNGVTYQEIAKQGGGIRSSIQHTRKASLASLKSLCNERIQEFIKQGVTSIEAKSGYGLDYKNELKILKSLKEIQDTTGLRLISTYLGPHAVPPEFENSDSYIQNIISNDLPKLAKTHLTNRVDIFVEKNFFSYKNAEVYIRIAKSLGFDFCIHAEQLSRSGSVELAVQYQAKSADHLIEINANDIKSLAKSDVNCGLLPASDLYMKMKYPPARSLLDQGARVFLATDFNPGTCPTQDISLVGLLARLEMKMNLVEVIVAYTLGASYALGIEKQCGSIEISKNADFIVLDKDWTELFYQIGQMPIYQTWTKGKCIYQKNSLDSFH